MKKLILLLFLFGQLLAQNTQQTIGVSTGDGGGINSNNIGSNGGNTLTSDVDGLIDTARLINTNILTWNSIDGLFTSTINGVAATVTIPRVSQAFPLQNLRHHCNNNSCITECNRFRKWQRISKSRNSKTKIY